RPIMRLKSRYIMHLEHYPFQKPPTNFSDEAHFFRFCMVNSYAWYLSQGQKKSTAGCGPTVDFGYP
ncbi:MAG: hypothetical protein AB2814_11995, partial [Candidatus Sedimenticola endophacoides]